MLINVDVHICVFILTILPSTHILPLTEEKELKSFLSSIFQKMSYRSLIIVFCALQ